MSVGVRFAGAGFLGLVAVCVLGMLFVPSVWGDDGDIRLVSSSVEGEFPDGIRFDVSVSSSVEVEEVAVRFRIGQRTVGAYEYLDLEASNVDGEVAASLFYRTNTSARYIPPGAIIRYNFEIEDVEGNRLDTESEEFVYLDGRFEWEAVSDGVVTVFYHGPLGFRAEEVLDAIVETLGVMGPLLGAGVDEPIRVTMYNNWPEMREVLPPSSIATRRELITEGLAYSEEGVLLVLGGSRRARGVAAHEVTHILVYRAGEGVLGSVPSWLNEGLAEYGNIDPGASYDQALLYAIARDDLLPITAMASRPGTSDDIIVFYGQARSIVRFMVDEFGEEKMRELMATLKGGRSIRNAVPDVYGVDLIELENLWRESLGASLREVPNEASALPTAVPTPALQLLTLDSLRGSGGTQGTPEAVEMPSGSGAGASGTQGVEVVEMPSESGGAPEVGSGGGSGMAGSETPSGEEVPAGGACAGALGGGGSGVEVSSVVMLAGLGALWAGRRMRRVG